MFCLPAAPDQTDVCARARADSRSPVLGHCLCALNGHVWPCAGANGASRDVSFHFCKDLFSTFTIF